MLVLAGQQMGLAHMTALLIAFLAKFWPVIAAAAGIFGWGFYRERKGIAKERAKQAAAEARARDIRDEVQNDVGALTPEQRRERLKQWPKH